MVKMKIFSLNITKIPNILYVTVILQYTISLTVNRKNFVHFLFNVKGSLFS